MKTINTLVKDIYDLFSGDGSGTAGRDSVSVQGFGQRLAGRISSELVKTKEPPRLRLSSIGVPCARQLWYKQNIELNEDYPPEVLIKFLYGNILEELVIWLAREAGHIVTDEQKEVSLGGVRGHLDCLIDGELVDIKSCSSLSFDRFSRHLRKEDDSFGYLGQLQGYAQALGKQHAYFLAIDKTLGRICLDKHNFKGDYTKVVEERKEIISSVEPPEKGFPLETKSFGNLGLGLACSYCSYRKVCYPNLRTFSYAKGPAYLVKIYTLPNVPEIK